MTNEQMAALLDRVEKAERERDELRLIAEQRWKADMRAIRQWQEEVDGRELKWPDHADLVCWLLEGWEECTVDLLACIKDHNKADAQGYARGVRDAAGQLSRKVIKTDAPRFMGMKDAEAWEVGWNGCRLADHTAILALLPTDVKEGSVYTPQQK